jgi:ABC-type nitrate/sulfonate/bicarbonate transport system substrate-binding protein
VRPSWAPEGRNLAGVYAAAIALAMTVAACGSAQSSGTGTKSAATTTVKIACNREFSEVFIWELGNFSQKYGITPQCTEVNTFDESLQALTNGSVSVGILGIPEIPTLAAKNLPLKVIAGYTDAGQDIVIRNGENITSWSQFAGKTVCVPEGTGVATMVDLAFLQKGLMNKVKIQGIGFVTTAAIQGLKNGTCDALAYWSPVMEEAVDQNAAHFAQSIELNDATSMGAADGVIVASNSFLQNRELAVNFLKAYVASMNYYQAHPSQWESLAAQLTGTSMRLSVESYPHQVATYKVDLKAAEAAATYGPALGYESTNVASKIPSVIDVSLLAAATGQSQASLLQSVKFTGSH